MLTSIYTLLLGNYTFNGPQPEDKSTRFLIRTGMMTDLIFDDYNTVVLFTNKFGSLHFVSCGSRGFEGLQIDQLLSVFETNVWKCMLVIGVSLIVTMNLLRGSLCPFNSLDKITGLVKFMREQSIPYPEKNLYLNHSDYSLLELFWQDLS